MDPLAHTLAGAALAETRLSDSTPLAAPALILGSNLPDIDAVTMLVDGDLALGSPARLDPWGAGGGGPARCPDTRAAAARSRPRTLAGTGASGRGSARYSDSVP